MRRLNLKRRVTRRDERKGAALVEFAVIAPIFLTLVLGTVESLRAVHTTTKLSQAIREGGRLASMDWSDVLPDGTTPNEKVENDIKNFLNAAGTSTDEVEVTIKYADGPKKGQDFELGTAENYLELFEIRATIPPESSFLSGWAYGENGLSSGITFRAGHAQFTSS
ncbi:TadE/TadG family type IV pilus assembly protein [Calycomorphotria hydatis]|uniref:TadE-like protein n=1 Tax=Calycomorphotria hydatis TaxID=2528027 RepID=A0A517TCM2_9PLAN|nr:TadE family protein [Calycomorphotria hydatis]QDT66118.1 TadE-like protein [Calycomorphotria hydatis]